MVARSRAAISIVVIEQMGYSGASVARALNVTPSADSKLVLRARNDPALKDGIKSMCLIRLAILACNQSGDYVNYSPSFPHAVLFGQFEEMPQSP
ncbi:MAG: hypothetical protein WBN03_04425 [Desulfobacterales bacterium]